MFYCSLRLAIDQLRLVYRFSPKELHVNSAHSLHKYKHSEDRGLRGGPADPRSLPGYAPAPFQSLKHIGFILYQETKLLNVHLTCLPLKCDYIFIKCSVTFYCLIIPSLAQSFF